jgi:Carboxypeptidase regulatory-like domain/Matrixin
MPQRSFLRDLAARLTITISTFAAAALVACGGGGHTPVPTPTPLPPTPPPPIELVVLGRVIEYGSGRPIVAATVQPDIVTTALTTDANGEFRIGGVFATKTVHLRIDAPGYITRETYVRFEGGTRTVTLDLLHEGGGFSLEYYRQLARDSTAAPALEPLWRLTDNPNFYVRTVDQNGRPIEPEVLRGVYAAIPKAVTDWSAHKLAMGVLETGTATRPRTPGWIVMNILREKEAEFCGLAQIGAVDGQIELWDDRCSCGSNKLPGALVAHEVGHALGFFHVTDENAVMFPTFPDRCPNGVLTTRERFHAAVAYSRARGNTDQDVDPDTMVPLAYGTSLRIKN